MTVLSSCGRHSLHVKPPLATTHWICGIGEANLLKKLVYVIWPCILIPGRVEHGGLILTRARDQEDETSNDQTYGFHVQVPTLPISNGANSRIDSFPQCTFKPIRG